MNRKIKHLILETKQLIDYKSRIFIINTLLLSVIFLVMNFFTVAKYNLVNLENYLSRNIQIKLILADRVEAREVEAFEKELIDMDGVDYHSYSAKELAIKSLENRMDLNLSQRNPLKNSIIIYTKDIKSIEDLDLMVDNFEKRDIVERVLFNREFVEKLMKARSSMSKMKFQISIFFTLPLFVFIYLVFKLNFINYESELREKYLNAEKDALVISPYFLKKVLNIFLAWVVALVLFSSFYEGAEKLLYDMSPNINIIIYENLPKMMFINQLIISLIILVFSGMLIRVKGGRR